MDELLREYEEVEKEIERLKGLSEALRGKIFDEMKADGLDSYMSKVGVVNYIPGKTSYVFNSTGFKADEPEVYKKYLTKERVVNEQIRISIRKS